MRRRSLVLALAAASMVAVPALVGAASADPSELAPGSHPGNGNGNGNQAVYQYARGQSGSRYGGGSRVLMTNHGGPVMHSVQVTPIFWGTSWPSYTGDEISGIDTFYTGFLGSRYAAASTEYTDTKGTVLNDPGSNKVFGHLLDSTAASGGQNTGTILNEVAKMIPNPAANGYYPVYTDLPRGNAGYCAWHSNGTVKGVSVQFAFFWKLDGDAGCDPQSTVGGQTEGLAASANVSGHELSEAMTDPALNAWYDGSGNENGDKCAWSFGAPYVTFTDGTRWKIQGEWSNNVYNKVAGYTGYANNSGQLGCLSGA